MLAAASTPAANCAGKPARFISGIVITPVDTVGAGDAFASVAILGLQREWPYELIIERAQRFAALLVGTRGATLTESAPYQALLAKWL